MRDCTCVGSCRGAEGLGVGWNCVVDNGSVYDARILDGPASGAPAAVDERSTERATAESTGTFIERALTQAYVAGQMDAQATAQEKFKVGAGGPMRAMSRNAYQLAQVTAAEATQCSEAKYYELIYAVGNKHKGETRHQTALRYIRQAEESRGIIVTGDRDVDGNALLGAGRGVHGETCPKAPHTNPDGGYLHAADDDSPFNVDGVSYCGRCHVYWPHFLGTKA